MSETPLNDLFERLTAARFRKSKSYDPPHEYIMTSYDDSYTALWHEIRVALVNHGIVRPFYKSRAVWKYLDGPDGYTYWIMPQWLVPDWENNFDPFDNYIINRQRTDVAKNGSWTKKS